MENFGASLERFFPREKEEVIKLFKRHRLVPVMTGGFPRMTGARAASTAETRDIALLIIRKKYFHFPYFFVSFSFLNIFYSGYSFLSVNIRSLKNQTGQCF